MEIQTMKYRFFPPGCTSKRIPLVSLVALIANPELYHGKRVRVNGFLVLENDGQAIYLNRDDYDNLITKNAVWIKVGREGLNHIRKHIRSKWRYCALEGVFDAQDNGNLDLWSGSLKLDDKPVFHLTIRP
jgi:hypothetical protein